MNDAPGKTGWRSALDVAATLSIIAACLTFVAILVASRFDRPSPAPSIAAEARDQGGLSESPPEYLDLNVEGSAVKGSLTARVGVVEFSDFECPFCGRFARDTFPTIAERYVDSGRVRYAFRHFPIESRHPRALQAAVAAECGRAAGRFWDMHQRLFELPLRLDRQQLTDKARSLGLDQRRFTACLDEATNQRVSEDAEMARRLRLTGTPSFLFGMIENGRLRIVRRESGAIPAAAFSRILDILLAQKAE